MEGENRQVGIIGFELPEQVPAMLGLPPQTDQNQIRPVLSHQVPDRLQSPGRPDPITDIHQHPFHLGIQMASSLYDQNPSHVTLLSRQMFQQDDCPW